MDYEKLMAIAKCDECYKFFDCDSFYDDKNIIKCAIKELIEEL